MSEERSAQDPLEFVSKMWNTMGFPLPGMVTPTLDIDELDKRIGDLRAVEHWLKMNLNMLQMTTQGLEMQRAAIAAVKAMSEQASEQRSTATDPGSDDANPFAAGAMWPWNLMTSPVSEPATRPDSTTGEKPKAKGRGAPRGSGSSKPPAKS